MRNLKSSVDKISEDTSLSSDSFIEMTPDKASNSDYRSESQGACSSADDIGEDSTDDELNMGMPGEKYTAADIRLLAKYIASVEDWKDKDDSTRFAKFHRRVGYHPSDTMRL